MSINPETSNFEKNAGMNFIEIQPPAEIIDFSPVLQNAMYHQGWRGLMPVQAKVAPYLLEYRDVLVQARTGSGKTGAYIISICEKIKKDIPRLQAIVLTPTRQKTLDVAKKFENISWELGLTTITAHGGSKSGSKKDSRINGAQILIGTPGRILELLIKDSLSIAGLQYLIFDEADELISMGFERDILRMLEFLPNNFTSAIFSTTLSQSLKRFSKYLLHRPQFISISEDSLQITGTDNILYVVDSNTKDKALIRLVEMESPPNAIVFCNAKSQVEKVAATLKRHGYETKQLTTDLSPSSKETLANEVKNNKFKFLVATDLAARGIDISQFEYIFIYDMHKDLARQMFGLATQGLSQKRAVVIILAAETELPEFVNFARRSGLIFEERTIPTEQEAYQKLCEKLLTQLEAGLRDASSSLKERMKRYQTLLEEIKKHDQSQNLMLLLIDTFQQYTISRSQSAKKTSYIRPYKRRGKV